MQAVQRPDALVLPAFPTCPAPQPTRSRGLKLGMEVDQPVPMPSAPLTSTVGTMGMYLQRGMGGWVGRGLSTQVNSWRQQ